MNRKLFIVLQVVLLAIIGSAVGTAAGRLSSPPAPAQHTPGLAVSPLTPVGSGFTYQGRLLDGGSPANGQYDFVFTLFDVPAGGSPVSSPITVTSQTVADGLVTVVLDFGLTAFQGDERFLDISVRQASVGLYTTLVPRQPLTPAPYAITASTVQDGSITTAKIANDATEPSRIESWYFEPNYSVDAAGSGSTNIIDPGITVTVPLGKAYYYQIIYKGAFIYAYGDRVGSNTSFYASWFAAALANNTEVGQECLVVGTGYRQDWSALGASGYWVVPYSASWLVRLEEGTHSLKVRFRGYSDGTMNRGYLSTQRMQIMRLY